MARHPQPVSLPQSHNPTCPPLASRIFVCPISEIFGNKALLLLVQTQTVIDLLQKQLMRLLSAIAITITAVATLLLQAATSVALTQDISPTPAVGVNFTAPVSMYLGDDEYFDIPATFTITGEHTAMIGDGNDEAIFKRYSGTLVIPDSVEYEGNYYTITKVADNAFSECSRLTGVVVSDSVSVIGSMAFGGCLALEDVKLPSALDSIAPQAFNGNSSLHTITFPKRLRAIAPEAFSGASEMRYVDARQAQKLAVSEVRASGSPFADFSDQTIIYTPIGIKCGNEPNVIATDSLGTLSCSKLTADFQEFCDEDCHRGMATHELNAIYNDQVFGQELGKDLYPIPAKDTASFVARVAYYVGNDLKCDDYVNYSKCVTSLPSPQSLGFDANALTCFRYSSDNWFEQFTTATPVNADIDVFAYKQSLPGNDGFLFVDSLTVINHDNVSKKIPALFRVTSQADHTVSLGDGIYNATDRNAAGTLVIPDTIVLDSTSFRVTALADNALASCPHITTLGLPHGLERIGTAALQSCSTITQLTLPAAVQTISNKAFAGCNQLRYIDMRQAATLEADTIASGNGMLEQLPENTIVYAPKGFTKAGGSNVIATDTTGHTRCYGINANGTQLDSANCASGAATYLLNSIWKQQVFGQRLGTDNTPLPLATQADMVHRIEFFNRDSLCVTVYANHGKTIALPTPAALGLTTSQAELVYYIGSRETAFTDTTAIYSDLTVHAFPKAVAGEDGYTFTHKLSYTGISGDTLTCDATFAVTSYAQKTLQLGDGRHKAISANAAQAFCLPDTLVLDSVPYALTLIAETAFQGCDSVQTITLPDPLRNIAHGAFNGCQQLRYIDMRRATHLSMPDSAAVATTFWGISPSALLYLPIGHATVNVTNAISTDSLGNTSCTGIRADNRVLTATECASGAAAYLLNRQYGTQVFGQKIGSESCPTPCSEPATAIHRVKFVTGFEVAHTAYANPGNTVALPDTSLLHYATHHSLKFYTLSPDGTEQTFTSGSKISGDTAVWVKEGVIPGDINNDNAIDSTDVQLLVSRVLTPDSTMSPDEITAADIDRNGIIDISDVTALIDKTITPDSLPSTPDTKNKPDTLNVIIIGNSFACDAYFYVPFIMRNVAPKLKVTMHIFNQSGATLGDQWSLLSENKKYHSYHVYNGSGVWWSSRTNEFSVADILKSNRNSINLVLLQQGSAESANQQSYQPYVNDIVHALKDSIGSHVEVGFLLTPAYPQDSWWLTTLGSNGLTSNEMYELTAKAIRKTLDTSDVNFIIPAGTAIQNARTTALDSIGKWQYHHLSCDGMHLQDGAPCLIEGYMVSQALLQHMHRSETIWDEKKTLPITKEWLETIGAREVGLPVQGMEPSNIELVKRSVRAALKTPFSITDCSQPEEK